MSPEILISVFQSLSLLNDFLLNVTNTGTLNAKYKKNISIQTDTINQKN